MRICFESRLKAWIFSFSDGFGVFGMRSAGLRSQRERPPQDLCCIRHVKKPSDPCHAPPELLLLLTVILTVVGMAYSGDSPARADAYRLVLGEFEYREVSATNTIGRTTLAIRTLDARGTFEFSARTAFSVNAGFSTQEWKCVTNSRLEPISARLNMGQGSQKIELFTINYSHGTVRGVARARRGGDASNQRTINTTLKERAFDQRIDWAVILGSDLSSRNFEFDVYDPYLGISRAKAHVGTSERVQVPAGSFDVYPVVYQISNSAGNEEYKVFVTRGNSRILVREDFQNGVISELVKVNPQ